MVNPWKVSTFVLIGLLAAVVGGSAVRTASAEKEAQPYMRGALTNLKQAKSLLEKASGDKGGHRVKALKATEDAIAEVEAGIKFDNGN